MVKPIKKAPRITSQPQGKRIEAFKIQKAKLKKAAFETFTKKESFRNFVHPNVHKNGNTVILQTSGVPILNDRGELLGYRGADTDITEQKRF